MKEVTKVIRQGLVRAIAVIYGSVIIGLVISACQCDCLIHFAKIGEINLYKKNNVYQAVFTSSLDRTETTGSSENSFELSLIKTVVDAGVDKFFPVIYVRRGCFDQLRKAYGTIKSVDSPIYKSEYENPILTCELYGEYNNALNVYDRDMYDSTMIDKVSSTSDYPYDDPRKITRLITR